ALDEQGAAVGHAGEILLHVGLISVLGLEQKEVDGFAWRRCDELGAEIVCELRQLFEQWLLGRERKIGMARELAGLALVGPAVFGAAGAGEEKQREGSADGPEQYGDTEPFGHAAILRWRLTCRSRNGTESVPYRLGRGPRTIAAELLAGKDKRRGASGSRNGTEAVPYSHRKGSESLAKSGRPCWRIRSRQRVPTPSFLNPRGAVGGENRLRESEGRRRRIAKLLDALGGLDVDERLLLGQR